MENRIKMFIATDASYYLGILKVGEGIRFSDVLNANYSVGPESFVSKMIQIEDVKELLTKTGKVIQHKHIMLQTSMIYFAFDIHSDFKGDKMESERARMGIKLKDKDLIVSLNLLNKLNFQGKVFGGMPALNRSRPFIILTNVLFKDLLEERRWDIKIPSHLPFVAINKRFVESMSILNK
ncbi:MAG: hypothetical protein JRI44_13860 [Deltaproteobacteria bacterium]|nr:hypothetical protein [Deltaproteobacteria bacterium]